MGESHWRGGQTPRYHSSNMAKKKCFAGMTRHNPPSLKTQDQGLVTTTQPSSKTPNATEREGAEGGVQGTLAFFFYFLITNYSISSNLSK